MNKGELINAIADDSGLTKTDVTKVINSLVDVVTYQLKSEKDAKISILGFVTITKERREARTGRNPQTGKEIQIPAKNVVKFKAGKAIQDEVNS